MARREQWRLLLLVMGLCGVVWLAMEAREPERFRWILEWGRDGDSVEQQVDTRVAVEGAGAADDTFVLPPPGQPWQMADPQDEGALTEEDLAAIRDDEPFRKAEHPAWFKLFGVLQTEDQVSLDERSIGPVTFIQLYRQPKEYRGELVELRGTLRRSEPLPAPPNDHGIESYYRTWVFPDDNPSNPIVVYTLSVPDGFPSGMTLVEKVELQGFFFKRWPYVATDAIRTAPVVLASELDWIAMPEAESPAPPLSIGAMLGLATAFAALVVIVVWWRTRTVHSAEPEPAVLDALGEVDYEEPHDSTTRLRLLAEAEQESE